jgi:hypothetical protein
MDGARCRFRATASTLIRECDGRQVTTDMIARLVADLQSIQTDVRSASTN